MMSLFISRANQCVYFYLIYYYFRIFLISYYLPKRNLNFI